MSGYLIAVSSLAAALTVSACGNRTEDPNRTPESVRGAQKLFKGQQGAVKTTRLPNSHDNQHAKEGNK